MSLSLADFTQILKSWTGLYYKTLNHPSGDTAGQQLTCEAGKVSLQVRGLDFVSQDVSLIEEEDNGGVLEPGGMDGGVEQCEALVHSVLQTQTESESRFEVK